MSDGCSRGSTIRSGDGRLRQGGPIGDDERTREVTRRLIADGEAWMSGSRWQGRDVLRISVSNWSTDADDVARSLDAVRRAATPSADRS